MTQTHFGFQQVPEEQKVKKVAEVFHSVAAKYDVMNDLMSAGLHRLWKAFTITQAAIRPGFKVLDIAAGTGDLTKAFAKRAGPTGEVWHTDINESMLRVGRDRMINHGLVLPTLICDAEKLPFPDNYFDRVSVAFGLRNMTHKDAALAEMRRELTDFCTQPRVIELVELTGMDAGQVGHDFWLTRNHHGAGFWDRGNGAAGDELSKLCHPYGESYLHIDENGSIYVS